MPKQVVRSQRWWLIAVWLVAPQVLMVLAACGSAPAPASASAPTPARSEGPRLAAQMIGTPTVSWDNGLGGTTIVVKFTARTLDGMPLGPGDVDVELLLDDKPLDNESPLQQGAEQLEIDLHYAMVLDATYSMLLHEPAAFEPMKAAARKSVETGVRTWKARPGAFGWDVTWFDDFIYRPEGTWSEANIMAIPTPVQGTFTRLYAAVDNTLDRLAQEDAALPAAGAKKRHNIVVVFSDGKDNHSGWSNQGIDEVKNVDAGLRYHKLGWPATSLDTVLTKIAGRDNLTVHTIGMGSAINDGELQKMATAGRGIFVKNPGSGGISSLFERVTQEFNTIQTRGATIPEAGDHDFTVVVRQHGGQAKDEIKFRIHAGDSEARVVPPAAP